MKAIIAIYLLFWIQFCQAQNTSLLEESKVTEFVIDPYKCYKESDVDVKPNFTGGEVALAQFIMPSFQAFPLDLNGGKIVIHFCIEKDGRVSAIEIPNPKYKKAKDALLESMRSAAKWSPAKIRNTPVRCSHTATLILNTCK
jgi:hypothetical protein